MPITRSILCLLCFVALPTIFTFFSLLHSHPRGRLATESDSALPQSGARALFSFRTPATLFPPSAIISLTDDNSTFFLARPSDFGPALPSNGLSGKLWIGSGFGDDNLGRGGAAAGAEGELGCSDVPGWGNGKSHQHGDLGAARSGMRKPTSQPATDSKGENNDKGRSKRSDKPGVQTSGKSSTSTSPSEEDGTDDHLHHPLPSSLTSEAVQHPPVQPGQVEQHADIQSIQEGAEITGKVVLLSRGGCGFLEKVKWVQRRGGSALIVGDDTRGGPLITMYARGDTSNITIPALFTSHTTAHLLSSLIPSGGDLDDLDIEDIIKSGQPSEEAKKTLGKMREAAKQRADNDRPTFTPNVDMPKQTSGPSRITGNGKGSVKTGLEGGGSREKGRSWFGALFSGFRESAKDKTIAEDSRRPPSSGRINWVNEKWEGEKSSGKKADQGSTRNGRISMTSKPAKKPSSVQGSGDDFVIGVQDWRDPDLVGSKISNLKLKGKAHPDPSMLKEKGPETSKAPDSQSKHKNGNILAGGSITPGSGQYDKPQLGNASPESKLTSSTTKDPGSEGTSESESWFERIFGDGDDDGALAAVKTSVIGNINPKLVAPRPSTKSTNLREGSLDSEDRDGLWVTLSPTTISTSPFFDTLLVLVVSPLVTLTVVYALLLLRSRIRRRRWRAPKSVVDRLPVRTYHTMSCSSAAASSLLATPPTTSPTSPLLQSSPQAISSRSRPRSRTTSGIGAAVTVSLDKATAKTSAQDEKSSPPKRYNGKQVECVVCLEEYVDGHSRVMSLPCGHEFHAECM